MKTGDPGFGDSQRSSSIRFPSVSHRWLKTAGNPDFGPGPRVRPTALTPPRLAESAPDLECPPDMKIRRNFLAIACFSSAFLHGFLASTRCPADDDLAVELP